jgi:hypothetical protein
MLQPYRRFHLLFKPLQQGETFLIRLSDILENRPNLIRASRHFSETG